MTIVPIKITLWRCAPFLDRPNWPPLGCAFSASSTTGSSSNMADGDRILGSFCISPQQKLMLGILRSLSSNHYNCVE